MGNSPTTLSTALTNLRTFLDEPANPGGGTNFWSDTQLTLYLNMGCTDVERKAEILQAFQTIAVVAGTQSYVAPVDTMRIHRIEYNPSTAQQNYPLTFRGYNEMDAVWGINQQFQGAQPTNYTLWNNPPQLSIVTYPVPSAAGTLRVFYFRKTVDMVLGTDTMDTLPGYEDVVYDYAAYRAYQQDGNPMWQLKYQSYLEGLTNLISLTRTYQDQPNVFSSGATNIPAWLTGGYDQ